MSTGIVEGLLQLGEYKTDDGAQEKVRVCEKCGSTDVQCYSAYSTAGDSLRVLRFHAYVPGLRP